MMNLSRRISLRTRALIRGLHLHTEVGAAPNTAAGELARGRDDRLYRRLSALGARKGTVAKTINEYIREGKVPQKIELDRCITQLRKYGRHHHALEIMEWMATRSINYAHRDFAIQLDLIAKVKGIEEAEKYFSGLSSQEKNQKTYGALLNCYCTEKMADKALALFKEMDEMNIASTSLAFNNLMSLYMKLGQPEKVAPLVEDMKQRSIYPSTFTYNIWMNSCFHLDDIEGAERVFEEVKRDNPRACDWTIYSNLAVIYVKAGLHEKAELALKKLEEEMGPRNREAFHFLLSLYAGISNSSEVHRVWNSLRSNFKPVTNISYLVLLQALDKLNDVEGLKEWYKEWETSCSHYDVRLANTVIGNYLRHDLLEEAQKVLHQAIERSDGPFFKIWEMFMTFYLKNNQVQQALQCMQAATSRAEKEWHPKSNIVDEFFKHFEEAGDVDGAEDYCKLLKKVNSLKYSGYMSLLKTYVAAGKTVTDMRDRIQGDGIVIGSDLKDLLQRVCPE